MQKIAASHWPATHWVEFKLPEFIIMDLLVVSLSPEYIVECSFLSALFLGTIEYYLVSKA